MKTRTVETKPRPPLRIRPAVKDHSDLRWLKKRPAALEFTRADKELH
ncbi:MAG: hypothetical protein Q8N23_15845 [Archangium sp.]|nr:hypothetical protein [Archangium sp.]MDP3154148.1 hypothetical protein [Archangium sp.]MDP3569487.1 hypothetical protein [Archangium sp.]